MITKAQQRLVAKYGTYVPEEIIAMKSGIQMKVVPAVKKSIMVAMSADQCRQKCAAAGCEYLDGYENRVIRYTLSDEVVDRDGDIMIQDGVKLDNFKSNPVSLLFHDSHDFPIGNFLDIYVEGKELKGELLFVDDRVDPTGRAERAFRFARSRIMRAGSVGFRGDEVKFPTQEERRILGMKDYGVIFTRWELVEFSLCPVPSNPHALSDALRKGALKAEDLKFIETDSPEDEVLDMTKAELEALIGESLTKGLADMKTELEALKGQKAGRAISKPNLERLKCVHEDMEKALKSFKDMIDEHDKPDDPEETEADKAARETREKEALAKAEEDVLNKELADELRKTREAIAV